MMLVSMVPEGSVGATRRPSSSSSVRGGAETAQIEVAGTDRPAGAADVLIRRERRNVEDQIRDTLDRLELQLFLAHRA